MALIKTIEREEATGKIASVYELMMKNMGFIPQAFKVFSSSEHLFEMMFNNISYSVKQKRFSGKMNAFVRLFVSVEEECKYCVGTNTGILWQYGVLPEQIEEIKKDITKVPLEEKEKQLFFFILKVVKDSNSVEQADVDKLRELGWTDQDILEGAFNGAMSAGVDKIFNAFKIMADK